MLYKHETLIREAQGAFNRRYILAHVQEGEEIAGSGTRHVKECYRIVYTIGGTRHSQAFRTLEEASAYLDKYTQPIIEQKPAPDTGMNTRRYQVVILNTDTGELELVPQTVNF